MAQFYRWYNAQAISPLIVTPEEMARHFRHRPARPCRMGRAAGSDDPPSGARHAAGRDGALKRHDLPFGVYSIR
jgi:hypothetical protein